jgi:dienelactone hydrolase
VNKQVVRKASCFRCFVSLMLTLLLVACVPGGHTQIKIPVEKINAVEQSDKGKKLLIVILPGRGDDIANVKANGIATAIQSAIPEADIMLTGISLAYYMEGRMPQRLREETIQPARQNGYEEIWLVGTSMGGMGALLYDREYPREVKGMVLLAPFLGRRTVLKEITAAGSLENWQAGPIPVSTNEDNFDHEMWRYIQTWQNENKARTHDVWLGYGDRDRLSAVMPPLQKTLPQDHVFVREGGHAWALWTPTAQEIFTEIQKGRKKH